MTEPESMRLLDKLTEHPDFHTGIFFTYGADLAFFEEAILHPLRQNGCRNNLVLMDARRYADTIGDLRGSVTWVGRRYILIPVDLGPLQSFHPKLALLLGRERGRLLIGSGNLTFTGFGHNHEVFTCLDWTPDESNLQDLFAQTWDLVKAILQEWGHSSEAGTILNKAEYVADWLLSPAEPTTEIQLFHTLEEPLIDQCSRALSSEVIERITVLSPFLDDAAHALSELFSRFYPSELRLVLQDQRTVGNVHALEDLLRAGVPLEVYRFSDTERYLHAKVYVFETADASYVLTGSANCTRAGWLSACTTGNVEVMLLRRADSRQHFASLLEGRIASTAVASLGEINIRREQLPGPESGPPIVHLLDVSVVGGMLSVDFRVSSSLEGVAGLQLRLSTTPPAFIPLGDYGTDSPTVQTPIPPELQEPLRHPLSASVWGIDPEGCPVDLRCNELWITNVDALHRETRGVSTDIARTGDYLAEMLLISENEWRDLYDSLIPLIKLDIAQLKRQEGTYTAKSPDRKTKAKRDAEEQEVEIRLVDKVDEMAAQEMEQIGAAVTRESEFYAFFEYVRSRLPGAARDKTGEAKPPSKPRVRRRGRKWTPSERMGRRFVNLVEKYIRSLTNVEYMQTLHVLYTLAYYIVFQRMVWLLLQHDVIDVGKFVQLVTSINSGFFGAPDEKPPALCPRLSRHMQRVWRDDWRTTEVPSYALASVVLTEYPVSKPLVPEPLDGEPKDDEREARVHGTHKQNRRVLCGIASVMGISWLRRDCEILARQVSEVYNQDGNTFALQMMDHVEHSLSSIEATLDDWTRRVTIALGEIDDPHLRGHLCRARVDYGLARYDVLAYLKDVETQARLCSDLIFWMRRAGDSDAAKGWSETLVNLLEGQGKGHEAAQALFYQGRAHFLDQEHEEAATILRQALLLAERLGDIKLSGWCEQFLGHTEFFLQ